VAIVATATATNFVTANPEQVFIRLVPVGVILPPAGAPTAAFTFSPTSLSAGLPIQFDASTSRPGTGAIQISTYSWNFGDGTSGSGSNVTHKFGAGNNFVVTLTVTNDRGLAASVSQTLSVNPAALPTPSFTVSPSAPAVNQTVFFNGQASTAGQGHTIDSYRWNFGDGTSGSGSTVTHAFTATGTYAVQLTVTDDVGASVTSNGTAVLVSNAAVNPPTANFTFSPSAPVPNQAVLFNASSSTAGAGHTLSSYAWDFGDHGTGTLVSPSHTYTTTGTFTVTLTVTDEIGQSSVTSKTVTIATTAGTPPTASFTFSPAAPAPNQTVLFNASSSTPGAGHTIPSTGYAWDFGDGATGTGVTPSRSYSAAGTFTVTLTVTDEIGQTSVASRAVTISSSAATPPTPAFTFSPANPGVLEKVFFNASTSTPGAGHTIATYAWTFGDGNTGSGVTPTNTYDKAGTYSVQLKVTDEIGQSATSAAQTITVGNPPAPTANFTSSPLAPVTGQAVVFDASGSTTAQGQTITNYAWNFGDGTAVINCPSTGSSSSADCAPNTSGRIASHSFTAAGTFTVNLVVTDSAGRIGAKSAQVIVGTGNPTAVLVLSKTGGTSIQADGSLSTFMSGSTSIATYTFIWGDGTQDVTTSPANVKSHTYAAPVAPATTSTFTVTLRVTDNATTARSGTTSQSITVP